MLFKDYLKTIQRIYWNNLHLIIQNIKSYEKCINVYITTLQHYNTIIQKI
jgi:hypothetical protein